MKKVTILTACKNSADTIEQTILSVLNQTYKNIEYIIIDGVSTDGTLDIIKKYEGRLQCVSEPDTGLYDAYNKGLRMATGDVIGIIDSNDWYVPNAVEQALLYFSRNKVDLVYGDIIYIEQDGKLNLVTGDNMKRFGICQVFYFPTVFAKKELYLKYGLFDLHYHIFADMEWMLRLRCNGVHCGYLQHTMAYYNTDGLSSRPELTYTQLREVRKIFDEMSSRYPKYSEESNKITDVKRNFCFLLIYRGIEYRMIKYEMIVSHLKLFLHERNKQRYVIWGVGKALSGILTLIKRGDGLFRILVDKRKHGSVIENVPIMKPCDILPSDFVIVSSMKYYSDIKSELENNKKIEGRDFLSQEDFRWHFVKQYARKFVTGE